MKTKIKLLLLISAFIISQLISCKENQPTQPLNESTRVVSWDKDLDYLDSQMKSNEYEFSSLISLQLFDNTVNSIKKSIDSLQDYEIYIKIRQLIAALNVAHISTYPPSTQLFHFLPVFTRVFPDGVYIIAANQQNLGLLGKKIISIGGVSIQTVEDSLKKIISHENDYWFENQLPTDLSNAEILKYFGFTNSLNSVSIGIEVAGIVSLPSTEKTISNITSGFSNLLYGKSIPLYMQNQTSNYWYNYIADNKVLYIKYNACTESPQMSFDSFTNNIKNIIDSNQVKKVVVDIRNNEGGNSSIINPLLWYLEDSLFNQKGKLFLITGRSTFSSALLNAISFKKYTNCILVGEPTGGKPNSFGEIGTFSLPNSGIYVSYCTKYFQTISGDPVSLFPDYDIEISFNDYINCFDPVLNFILSYN